jgi:hypothetical protein
MVKTAWAFPVLPALLTAPAGAEPLDAKTPVRGWTILSNGEPEALAVINAAKAYNINHLELSHEIVMDVTSVRTALNEIPDLARSIREYPAKPTTGGQWNWVEDADEAMRSYDWIAKSGWPKETRGFPNPYAGLTFK